MVIAYNKTVWSEKPQYVTSHKSQPLTFCTSKHEQQHLVDAYV